jgi:hypothetical protein
MTESATEIVLLRLRCENSEIADSLSRRLSAHLEARRANPCLDSDRAVRLESFKRIDGLGAFDPNYLIGFSLAVGSGASALAVWCLAHREKTIDVENSDAKRLIDTIAPEPGGSVQNPSPPKSDL